MMAHDIVLTFINAFDRLHIPYILVGSYSSNVYGRPRSTKDADFVLELRGTSIEHLANSLGPDFMFDPQMSFESITGTMRYVASHRMSAFKVELFLLSSDAHDTLRFSRRQLVDFEGQQVWLPTPEDVIVTKLRWAKQGNRAKDIDDVAKILGLRAKQLDLEEIRRWTDQHRTREIFETLLDHALKNPPPA